MINSFFHEHLRGEERARTKFLSSEEVKESSKKIFQQIWAAAFIGTHHKEKPYSIRKAQKSRKRDNKKGIKFEADLGTNSEATVLLKFVQSVQQVLGTFFEVGRTAFNVVLLLEIFCFGCLLIGTIFEVEFKHRNRDKLQFVVAGIFTVYFSFSVKAISEIKKSSQAGFPQEL